MFVFAGTGRRRVGCRGEPFSQANQRCATDSCDTQRGILSRVSGAWRGFCAIPRCGVAISKAASGGAVKKNNGCRHDVHHGRNRGIFRNDPRSHDFDSSENNYPRTSRHQASIFNMPTAPMTMSICALIPAVQKALDDSGRYSFTFGGPTLLEDQLGGLSLTKEGLKQRDRRFSRKRAAAESRCDDTRRRYARRVETPFESTSIHPGRPGSGRETSKVHRCALEPRAVTARDFRQAMRRLGSQCAAMALPNSLQRYRVQTFER